MRKRSKLRGWKYYYPKLDKEMSLLVREKGECEWCHSTTNQMQWAHVIGRGNKALRWDIMNAMCLCAGCHLWKWHQSPLEAQEWFKREHPGRYEYLMQARHMFVDRTEEDYLEIWNNIRERNIKALIVAPHLLT